MMFAVALVGPDGSGKTTIAKRLLASFPLPMKYIYMGTAIGSSNFALPTSRFILYLKRRSYRKFLKESGRQMAESVSTHELEYRKVKRGKTKETMRQVNDLAEEWFRQIVSWLYQLRGYIVLCDRHFVFEHLPESESFHRKGIGRGYRIHLWFLHHFYPRPQLVIFLDAPAEILFSRKKEWTLERLERHRQGMLEQGQKVLNFVRVDATQPPDKVYARVEQSILQFDADRRAGK